MKARSRGELQALVLISLLISNAQVAAKSVIEPCNSNDSCPALLAYRLPWGSSFSDIASRFQVNISEILAANNIDPARPLSRSYQVLAANSLVKVPVSCSCVDGIRWSISTAYTVRAADTFYSISQGYGELVSPQQIRSVNGVNETTAKGGLVAGQRMVVPLPCTCFGNRNNGAEAVYMSYVVEKGENLSGIADAYGTTVTDLETVNGLTLPRVRPRDILSVPLPACSLTNLNWHNESLTVANGSYALTANNCINCGCAPTDLSLQCSPSGIAASCTHLQCKGSTLFIGQAYEKRADFGCNLTACVYRGHLNNKIFSSLLSYSHIHCSGNKSHAPMSPSNGMIIPFLTYPPSPSPSPSPSGPPDQPTVVVPSNPSREHNTNNSREGRLLIRASFLGLILLELSLSFIL